MICCIRSHVAVGFVGFSSHISRLHCVIVFGVVVCRSQKSKIYLPFDGIKATLTLYVISSQKQKLIVINYSM